MPRFNHMKGVFGLLPTPYTGDYEIHTADLRAAADFCCRSGQHGIVWPVMVGEFYFLGEEERIRNLDAVLEEVNGRLPVVFGCSGVSLPQVLLFARAAQKAGADAIIAMAPARSNAALALEMFRRLADAYDGPIMLQNAATYAPLTGEQIAQLVEHQIRTPARPQTYRRGASHCGPPHQNYLWRFCRALLAGRTAPRRRRLYACLRDRGLAGPSDGAVVGRRRSQRTRPAHPPAAAHQPGNPPLYALHPHTPRRLHLDGRAGAGRRKRTGRR
jgi:hypothetical protein